MQNNISITADARISNIKCRVLILRDFSTESANLSDRIAGIIAPKNAVSSKLSKGNIQMFFIILSSERAEYAESG